MNRIAVNSYAKLNLYLRVLNKRKDGYHNIETLFEKIGLCDKIILKIRPDKKINIKCACPQVPEDNSNLAYKAARLLQDDLNLNKGVDITLIKRIPVAAGLAGGSGNAAAVLKGLNKLWGLNLTRRRLLIYAKQLGADVSFFLYEAPFAIGRSRGDKIKPLNNLNQAKFWHILVVPRINSPTQLIYGEWDEFYQKRRLTTAKYNVKILILALRKSDFSLINKTLFNGLEQVSASVYPQIRQVKKNSLSWELSRV